MTEETKSVQPRKKRGSNGNVEQKKMTFKLDNANVAWLDSKPNKGRYINDLISNDKKRAWLDNGSN